MRQISSPEPTRNAVPSGSGMIALTSKAPGVLPDGENQVEPLSAEIASAAVSRVEFRFQSIESLRSAMTVIQYRVPLLRAGFTTEFKTRGRLFVPNVPKALADKVKES